ncbi:MAG TPA: outer membrane beta-barrel protein [Candidatus Aquabacterium excrementipullorum]|nr:outer membrane beta-barrel protein [Candidatus Aquabacterium excrementipullorum]
MIRPTTAPRWATLAAGAALSTVCALATVSTAQAATTEGPWLVRVRAVNLDSANKDDTGLDLSINDKVIPELDISYFITPNIAAELILTVPQKHDIRSGGTTIGSLKHLPPTLTVQYHFLPEATVRPYVGAGVNYTRFSSVHFDPAVQSALQPSVDKDSWGWALQAGVDFKVANNLYVNLDIKKVQIRADISSYGNKVGTFKVDPVLLGVGLGWRF